MLLNIITRSGNVYLIDVEIIIRMDENYNDVNIQFSIGTHRGEDVIWIDGATNFHTGQFIKNIVKGRYAASVKRWFLPYTHYNAIKYNLPTKSQNKSAISRIHIINQPALENMRKELQLLGYSVNTIQTYTKELAQLLALLKENPVNDLSDEKIRSYFLYCHNTLKLSDNAIHSRINAIKFYFEKVLKRPKVTHDLPRPKKPSKLPKALSKQDIKKMLSKIDNPKHLIIIKLCYGMGLRVSEIVNLKLTDIDSDAMRVLIEAGKGKKDRYTTLPTSILHELRLYYQQYRPKYFLFEGPLQQKFSIRSVQNIFKDAMKKANINKVVGVHSLRHSYATHLIEQGTDIRHIQDLLGHNNIRTTMIYTQLTDLQLRKIQSPLDDL